MCSTFSRERTEQFAAEQRLVRAIKRDKLGPITSGAADAAVIPVRCSSPNLGWKEG
jgi:hypothetical protein